MPEHWYFDGLVDIYIRALASARRTDKIPAAPGQKGRRQQYVHALPTRRVGSAARACISIGKYSEIAVDNINYFLVFGINKVRFGDHRHPS